MFDVLILCCSFWQNGDMYVPYQGQRLLRYVHQVCECCFFPLLLLPQALTSHQTQIGP